MTIEVFEITDRQAWLDRRKQDVTASVIPALFGCHPYGTTALRLYAEKRGVEFPERDESDKVLRRGRWLEPAVAHAVGERRPDWTLRKATQYYSDTALHFGATPDYFVDNDPRGLGVLQTKTVRPSVLYRDWQGGEHVPFYVVLQTLTECLATGAVFGAAAALLVDADHMDLFIFEIPRHPAAEAKIVEAVNQFWRCVDLGIEPQPDFANDADTIRALRPKEIKGKGLDLAGNNAIRENLEQRAMLMARIKADTSRCEEIETEIKYLLGDAEYATGLNGWRITYKSFDRTGYTVAPRTVRSLRITDQRPPEQRPDGTE